MRKDDLQFSYPEELIATEPRRPSRVLWASSQPPREISMQDLLEQVKPGDLWIVNETKVLKRRIFAGDLEILFLTQTAPRTWQVLFPSAKFKVGHQLTLPGDVQMKLIEKGRPQSVEVTADLSDEYFAQNGEVPLPPYIQKARGDRHSKTLDDSWYQTFWAEKPGSLAAPTASLHFEPQHFEILRAQGVTILPVTLHVGLGTFLPVTADDLNHHTMHFEEVEIPAATWAQVQETKARGGHIWAIGTTVARTLESAAHGKLQTFEGGFRGATDLFILPGFEFRIVDRLLTNFHQPESTLLALVAAFNGLEKVKAAYQWAIAKKFRLFSYGDLSVWIK